MNRLSRCLALAAALMSLTLAVTAGAGGFAGYAKHHFIVRFEPGYAPSGVKSAGGLVPDDPRLRTLMETHRVRGLEQAYPTAPTPDKTGGFDMSREWVVSLAPDADLDAAMADFARLPEVSQVLKDELYYVDRPLPNDPELPYQWYLRNTTMGGKDIRAVGGWAEALGDSNVIVAIIDSGVDWHHPDLADAIWINWPEYNGLPNFDDDGNGKVDDIRGWDFVNSGDGYPDEDVFDPDNDPMDYESHGTACAGTVGAVMDNGLGIASVAGGVKIMAVRVGWLPDGSSLGVVSMLYASQGIMYAVQKGARILNCSWGTSSYLANATDYAHNQGAIIVNAAGNDDSDVAEYYGTHPYVLSVASVNASDQKSSFSNYGSWIELCAPGEGIKSTWYDHTTGAHTYASVNGTSFASPITCGALALIWSAHPDWTATQVQDLLLSTCDSVDDANPSYVGLLGSGRINLLRALGDNFQQVPDEFEDWFDAVNESAPGDTIAFTGGTVVAGPLTLPDKALLYLGGWDGGYGSRDPLGNPTIIQGIATGTTLQFDAAAGPDVVVDGFRCTGGGGNYFTNIPFSGRFGGGIIVSNASPTLRNLEVTGNACGSASQLGSGGGILLKDSNAVLENVHVHGNSAVHGWGIHVYRGAPTLSGCVIEDNTGLAANTTPPLGGGIYAVDADLTLEDCTVSGHTGLESGGGIYAVNSAGGMQLTAHGGSISGNSSKGDGSGLLFQGDLLRLTAVALTGNSVTPDGTFMYGGALLATSGTVQLDSLTVTGNTGLFGGGIVANATASFSLTASLVAGNSGNYVGGGLYLISVPVADVSGNTFADNFSSGGGGGMYLQGTDAAVSHNIVAFNTGSASVANGIHVSSASPTFDCNDVYGNQTADYDGVTDPTGTAGNVSVDPEFCDAGAGDYTLFDTSPCLAGNSGGCGQIGALGQGCSAGTGVDDGELPGVPRAFAVEPNFPNPFNPTTTIRFALPAESRTRVAVYDVAGHLVRTLLDARLPAAVHTVQWDGRDEAGREMPTGVYFYRVEAGDHVFTDRMALIK